MKIRPLEAKVLFLSLSVFVQLANGVELKANDSPMGVAIRSTVRKAAKLAVYEEMIIRVKNHQIPPTILKMNFYCTFLQLCENKLRKRNKKMKNLSGLESRLISPNMIKINQVLSKAYTAHDPEINQ